jgi:hypothetical protein
MRSFRTIALLLALAVLLIPAAAKEKKIIESKWTATPVQVDGNNQDWAQEALEPNPDFNLAYSFKNDGEFLYLLFTFNNNRYMSSIDFSGLTIWANAESKEKKNYGLHFWRKAVTPDQLIQDLEKQGQALTDERKAQIRSQKQYILYSCDPLDKKGKIIDLPGTHLATFRTSKIGAAIVFEYQIPLALLQDPAAAVKWDATQPLKVGFEWGGSTEEMRKNQAAMMGDRGSQASARETNLESQIRGGEEGGGSTADFDATSRYRSLPKKYDFWVDLKIAGKQ